MLEPLFTDVIRFKIVVILFRNDSDFSSIKNDIWASDWNLSFHLKKLEKEWIIETEKVFENKKMKTLIRLTDEWRKKLFNHLYELENIVKEAKE